MSQSAKLQLPARAYEKAVKRLLLNEPLCASSAGAVDARKLLSAGENEALESVGLSTKAWRGEGKSDPLAQSIADYMALIETSLTTNQAARHLKVDPSRIRQRLKARTLYGVDYDGEKRLPLFQFARRMIIPGLGEVLAELPADLSPLNVAEWFLSPHPDLELDDQDAPLSPREWLVRGQPVAAVVALARILE